MSNNQTAGQSPQATPVVVLISGSGSNLQALIDTQAETNTRIAAVTSELDGGAPAIQARVPVKSDDTEESLKKRVLLQEHIIYPVAVGWFVSGRLKLQNNKAWLDNQPLPEQGFQHTSLSAPE